MEASSLLRLREPRIFLTALRYSVRIRSNLALFSAICPSRPLILVWSRPIFPLRVFTSLSLADISSSILPSALRFFLIEASLSRNSSCARATSC